MKSYKRIIAFVLAIILALNINIAFAGITTKAADLFQVTSPTSNSLIPAGPIDIEWSSASGAGSVKEYQVYVDGKLETTTSNTSYKFYTTKVNYHTVFVVACFTDGDKVSTSSVRFGVNKKGLCVNKNMGRCLVPSNMGASWYYDWSTEPLSYPAYSVIDFVPMIWGAGNEASKISEVAKNGYKFLLAYNEPDMGNNAGGSNISVSVGINNWKYFQGYNFYLGAPAPAFPPKWSSGTWIRTFMQSIDQKTVDFMPLHCYYDGYAGKSAATTFLKDIVDYTWEQYHKPIWITEFAPSKMKITDNNIAQVKIFLEEVLKGLDERSYVERYSWFSFDTTDGTNGAAALWTNRTGVLTEVGQAYVNNGNPKTDYIAGNVANNFNHHKSNMQVKKPARVKVKSAKNLKGRKVKLTFKKISGVVGYQIKASDSKKFKGYWTKNTKKTSYTFKKLDKNTRYYFKVRAYAKNGNAKLYGSWSKAKNVKVKK